MVRILTIFAIAIALSMALVAGLARVASASFSDVWLMGLLLGVLLAIWYLLSGRPGHIGEDGVWTVESPTSHNDGAGGSDGST